MGPSDVCLRILLQHDLSSSAMHEIQVINNFHDNEQCPHCQKCHECPSSLYCKVCQPRHASKREKNHAIYNVCNSNHLDNLQRSRNALPPSGSLSFFRCKVP